MKKISIIILALVILSIFTLSSCNNTKYVCADGSIQSESSLCTYNKLTTVRDRDAEDFAENYVKGYLKNSDNSYTLVNVYKEKGDFYANFVISSKIDDFSYESKVLVDGRTGSPKCIENCEFFQNTEITDIANPASIYCVENNGTLNTGSNENGDYGVCILQSGKTCEEWAYFKGECS